MRFPISRKNFAPAIIENCVVYLRRVVGFLLFFPPHPPTLSGFSQPPSGICRLPSGLLRCCFVGKCVMQVAQVPCGGCCEGYQASTRLWNVCVWKSSFYSIHIVHVQLEVPLKQPLFIKVYWEISFMFFKKNWAFGKYLLRLRNFSFVYLN